MADPVFSPTVLGITLCAKLAVSPCLPSSLMTQAFITKTYDMVAFCRFGECSFMYGSQPYLRVPPLNFRCETIAVYRDQVDSQRDQKVALCQIEEKPNS